MSRRKRQELEERIVSEWVSSVHPNARAIFRAWIGPRVPESYQAEQEGFNPAIYDVLGKWIDCIVLYPDRALLIEGKFKLRPEALGQILIYNELFMKSPKYQEYWNKQKDLIVLYAYPDSHTIDALRARGIQTIRYCPQWAQEAYKTRLSRTYRRR